MGHQNAVELPSISKVTNLKTLNQHGCQARTKKTRTAMTMVCRPLVTETVVLSALLCTLCKNTACGELHQGLQFQGVWNYNKDGTLVLCTGVHDSPLPMLSKENNQPAISFCTLTRQLTSPLPRFHVLLQWPLRGLTGSVGM